MGGLSGFNATRGNDRGVPDVSTAIGIARITFYLAAAWAQIVIAIYVAEFFQWLGQ